MKLPAHKKQKACPYLPLLNGSNWLPYTILPLFSPSGRKLGSRAVFPQVFVEEGVSEADSVMCFPVDRLSGQAINKASMESVASGKDFPRSAAFPLTSFLAVRGGSSPPACSAGVCC